METWQMLLGVLILTLATMFLTPALWSSHLSLRKSEREKLQKPRPPGKGGPPPDARPGDPRPPDAGLG